ncbi:VanW family protein [Fusibacter bizertensis]|uniref:VanW family protein n=1 Tax=Fusibacter bizertensis TaxID=1488331 RepID=A0ABT6N8W1_9FIRM|nr:VanW family protein [Fusibacter bizertensis]MDH8676834.1 VanW family protein [Fusibacter bizertensis]
MNRKSFSEINFLTYQISYLKNVLIRHIKWFFERKILANRIEKETLPFKIYEHTSLIRRRLGDVDMQLQDNKAINLNLVRPKIDSVVILPGEKFSFWYLVGKCTRSKGFKEGLIIKNGEANKGIGGGMCQFTNLIHWLVLHSPLTVLEHHHHNGLDLFPDYGRQVPFGTGTSIAYNYIDYQFENNTMHSFQLKITINDEYIKGELYSDLPVENAYHLKEENCYYSKTNQDYYRNNEVYRTIIDKRTGNLLSKELIIKNHSKIMYDKKYIPKDLIMETL